jgi:hypothetical protein
MPHTHNPRAGGTEPNWNINFRETFRFNVER